MNGSPTSDGEALVSMRDRMGAVGGTLEIISSPGAGTRVEESIPVGHTPASA